MRESGKAGVLTAILFLLLLPAGVGRAQDVLEPGAGEPWPEPLSVEAGGQLNTTLGHGRLVTLTGKVARVALADDAIARVQIISPREVLLTGLLPGSTTVHVWLEDGRRVRYLLRVHRDLDLVRRALSDLDPRIHVEAASDGSAVILRGMVSGREVARRASERATTLLARTAGGAVEVMNLLDYPGSVFSVEDELEELLRSVDPRITVRRIQVGEDPSVESDTFVLEGQVRNVQALKRAVLLAERQLGGTGGEVRAVERDRIESDRGRGSYGGFGGAFGGFGGAGSVASGGGGGANLAFRGTDPRSSSLASQIARGLVITSESGRVVSLLEVDDLPQVMVSIRVLEVDRAKARRVGFDFRVATEHLTLGSFTIPGSDGQTTVSVDGVPAVSAAANVVGAFVDQTSEILSAIDFMTEKNLARAVAEPNVVTLSGELASIVVGGEVPIPTTAANQVSTFSGVFFQSFGVRLDIRPTTTESGLIALEVAPSIVRVAPGLAVGEVPGFQVQSVNTTARVRAGQSLLIGGLLSFEDGVAVRKLPGIGVIPLFRWKQRSRQERELLFLITPRIVDSEAAPQIDPTVEPPDPREISLPELEWPEHRQRYLEAEPEYLRPDGVAPEFVPLEYGDGYRWKEYDWDDEEWDETEYQAPLEAEPVTFTLEPADPGAMEVDPDLESGAALEPMAAEPVIVEPMIQEEAIELPPVMVVDAEPCLRLRPEPGPWSAPVDCLERFTRVEVLESIESWSRVRLLDGREGWMASAYLVPAAPEETGAAQEPAELSEPADDLELQIARAEAGQGELEEQLERIRAELDSLRAEGDGGSDD